MRKGKTQRFFINHTSLRGDGAAAESLPRGPKMAAQNKERILETRKRPVKAGRARNPLLGNGFHCKYGPRTF